MSRSRRRLAGPIPFGLGETKPHHYLEMIKVAWRNRDNLPYAWRVLNRGVCDGCALGTNGLRDWTMDGTHLCLVRLNLLRLNTMGAFDPQLLEDLSNVESLTSKELRDLGRLSVPLRRRRGEPGFTRVSWDEAWGEIGASWRGLEADRTSFYVTSRGITNEVYYVAQKVARFLGTNNVDNSARLCHSPSTAGLKSTLGVAATTCSYTDWYDADLIVFFGSNPANDQPVALKYLDTAKKKGARVLQVNAYDEPGMRRYWIPSTPSSAVFGSKIVEDTFLVRVGGDLAFLNAVAKVLIEREWIRQDFVDSATSGFEDYRRSLAEQSMEDLLGQSGLTIERVNDFARVLAESDRGVFVWSMGITQHGHGADTVRALCNVGLLREYVGRPGTGMMPIRGHSGVQGGAEMGAYSTVFPGGVGIDAASAGRFADEWGFPVPDRPGLTTVDALAAAERGELDGLYCIGGNFLETMPEPERVRRGLEKVKLRVHTDLVLTTQMMVEPRDTVFILPSRTRYEQEGGGTETTTERRVIYNPHIPGHQVGEARSEWEMLLQLAAAVRPESVELLALDSAQAIREEIARVVPSYAGIEKLRAQGDQFQWGGERLCADRTFPTADGKAHFCVVQPPERRFGDGEFLLATRRGKQFNSMIQAETDQLTGADRDHVFMAPDDVRALGLRRDDAIVLESAHGTFAGRVFPAPVAQGTLQGHWPEVNPLIESGPVDADGGVPDYNAPVRVRPADSA